MLDNTSFIGGYISKTKDMIEQKGRGKNLNKGIKLMEILIMRMGQLDVGKNKLLV